MTIRNEKAKCTPSHSKHRCVLLSQTGNLVPLVKQTLILKLQVILELLKGYSCAILYTENKIFIHEWPHTQMA